MQGDEIIMAPLRGISVAGFRNVFAAHFKGVDRAVAPFVPTVAGTRVKPAVLADVVPEHNQAIPLIPQVIGKDPEQLIVMLSALRALGYTQCDLNAGCPWPFVAKKGRGSGLMAHEKSFAEMLATGCAHSDFSVKVRLGLKSPDLLESRMELINSYPLREVCIHPRTAAQMYEGMVDVDRFEAAAKLCRHPVVYNGDIRTPADFQRLKERFPHITRWMIGRGLAVNPFLAEMIATGDDTRTPERLAAFLDALLVEYRGTLSGETGVIGRMKELWSYLHTGLNHGERVWDGVKICRTLSEYERIVQHAFKHFKGFC